MSFCLLLALAWGCTALAMICLIRGASLSEKKTKGRFTKIPGQKYRA